MNGINNNVSSSNYGFQNNNNSNNKNEDSVFDKILDSISDFFSGDDEGDKPAPSNNLSKAYMMKLESSNTYTLNPLKHEETLTERWAKENENVELKQKEKEIAKLKQNINTLQSKNKLLEKQNELMFQHTQASQGGMQATPLASEQTASVDGEDKQPQEKVALEGLNSSKVGLPTHTSIPKAVLEQQQNEIDELAASTKVEAPQKTIKEDDTRAAGTSDPASTSTPTEEVKA